MKNLLRHPAGRLFLLVLLVLVLGYFSTGDLDAITGSVTAKGPAAETGRFEARFCQTDDCPGFLIEELLLAVEAKCAFYDLDYEPLEAILDEVDLLVFEENHDGIGESVPARHGGLMHNKFCILDPGTPAARVITGSTNPTANGLLKNDNHLLLIEGAAIAENYEQEFAELKGGRERHVPNPSIMHTNTLTNRTFLIENYFCPEDGCEERVLRALGEAKESIRFMTFSFTSDPIGDLLVEKARANVTIEGIFERRQNSPYSEQQKLLDAGLEVKLDGNPATMHHKVFIIDAGTEDAAVIAGSYNPTANGNTRNDENLLIIHDAVTVKEYQEEFERIRITAS